MLHLCGFHPLKKCYKNISKIMPQGKQTFFSLFCVLKITMNVVLIHHCVDQKEFAKTLLEVLSVNVKGDFLWILLD